jgi:hypothetical protein
MEQRVPKTWKIGVHNSWVVNFRAKLTEDLEQSIRFIDLYQNPIQNVDFHRNYATVMQDLKMTETLDERLV